MLTILRAGGTVQDPELAIQLDRAFAKHVAGLSRFCAKELRGHPRELHEEIVQEVLLEAWKKLPAYTPDHPFRAFLFAIASHKCANARRKRRDALSEDGLVDPESGDGSVLQRLVSDERDVLVETASSNVLDVQEQEIVHLRYVLDYSREDVARQVGIEEEQVRVVLQRCRRRLEKELSRLAAERGGLTSWRGRV